MIVMGFFKKRRNARSFVRNLIKNGYTDSGHVIKDDFITGEDEKMGYVVIFKTDTTLEAVKSLAASMFPDKKIEFVSWD